MARKTPDQQPLDTSLGTTAQGQGADNLREIASILHQRPHLAHPNPQRITQAVECQGCGDQAVHLSRRDMDSMHIEK